MRRIPSILLAFLVATSALAADFSARVVGVSDGDTMTVLSADQTQTKIRLAGIDAPETGQDFGSRAKKAASELAFGKDVTIQPEGKDRYGRTIATVILPDGRSLNRELVREGLAWWYRQYAPNDAELATLESEAKAAKRGLWSQPGAIAPWDWRKGAGVAATEEVIGNRRSHVYHKPSCRGAAGMKETNRVAFKTAAEAEKAGYRKAGDCR
jgi:endonuclease YncB( thermonuclease family)